jgi:hypothetical protein
MAWAAFVAKVAVLAEPAPADELLLLQPVSATTATQAARETMEFVFFILVLVVVEKAFLIQISRLIVSFVLETRPDSPVV